MAIVACALALGSHRRRVLTSVLLEQDIRSTVAWICYAEDKRADGDDSILSRVLAFKHRTEPAAEQSNELAWVR